MEQNKITTWWKKVLLIVGIYIIWWSIFYGSWFILSNINPNFLILKILDTLSPFFILILGPISSFLIPKYLSKKIDISIKKLKIINLVVLFGWLIIFGFMILLLLSHWNGPL